MNRATRPLHVPVIGIAGWKRSGKTTLTVRLVETFSRRGYKVATVKHAHHAFQIDSGNTDSARHRQAGAQQVAVVSNERWALVRELVDTPEPALEQIIAMLDPCDLVIVEGYKASAIPKIELRRLDSRTQRPLADTDPTVIAIAADHPVEHATVPVYALDDIPGLVRLIESTILGSRAPGEQTPSHAARSAD